MSDFDHILRVSAELAAELPGVVFIGGVAVYLRAVNERRFAFPAESSHDSDFMVSMVDFSSLRDALEAVPNPRLGKYQVTHDGVDFDVYVERNHRLIVPYDMVYAHSEDFDGLRVASPEHLILLKLEAHSDRRGTAKGEKDERDLVTLSRICLRPRAELLAPYLRKKHVDALGLVARGSVFTELCEGNAHEAKRLRQAFERFAQRVTAAS